MLIGGDETYLLISSVVYISIVTFNRFMRLFFYTSMVIHANVSIETTVEFHATKPTKSAVVEVIVRTAIVWQLANPDDLFGINDLHTVVRNIFRFRVL